MRILIVSNLYPPHYVGGYEIRCAQVAEALQQMGHDVRVVTSVYGLQARAGRKPGVGSGMVRGVAVERCLDQYVFPPWRRLRPWALFQAREELADARRFRRIVERFRPDVVNWWSMWGLSKLLLPLPRRWGIPDVHWVEHWWMIDECGPDGAKAASFWTNLWEGTWGPRRLRSVLGVAGRAWEAHANREGLATRDLRIAPSHVCFVSNYMAQLHREAGFAFPSSEVIHGGVPTAKFRATVRARAEADPLQLLYAGQISADRGLHTIVEALGRLDPDQRSRMMLRVAGQGPPDYLIRVRTLVDRLGLTDRVAFLGKVSHDQMPALYRQHDVLVFSSSRPEGLPLTMIEAMLSGCAVVTTGSGGAREVADMAQLPTFPANDAASLAGWLGRFLRDAGEVHRIAAHGQQVALRHFGFDRMVDRFVESLATLHAEHARRVSIPLASRGRAERSVTAQ